MNTTRQLVRRRGIAYILALVLLLVCGSLAVAFAAGTDLNMQRSRNYGTALAARLQAESGLSFMLAKLQGLRLPTSSNESSFAANLATRLAERLNGTANLTGQSVDYTASGVTVPGIPLGEGSFTCAFTWAGDKLLRLSVTGASGEFTQKITIDLQLVATRSGAFDFGLASAGPINIFGNAKIVGVNVAADANVISTTTTSAEAIHVDGNAVVSGDLSASGENSQIVITGNPTVAGCTSATEIAKHVHLGVEPPDMPEYDVAPLAALATNVVNSSTPITNGMTLSNIRIAANTNPNFSGGVTINGIIYVEAPNIVKFDGQTTINGMVVTQPSAQPLSSCQLFFGGHVSAFAVETLPHLPQYAAIRQQTGTFVLAPGFGVTFAGRFSTVNGTIAADQLTYTGTADGVVNGSVIGLKDLPTNVGGTVDIYVDRQNAATDSAGFVKTYSLQPQPSSYKEITGG